MKPVSDAERVPYIRTWQRCTDGRYVGVEIYKTDNYDGRCSMIDVYFAAAFILYHPATFPL